MEKSNFNQNFKDFKGKDYMLRNQYNQIIATKEFPEGVPVSVKDRTLELLGEAQEEGTDGKKKIAQYMLGVKIAGAKTLVELSADEIGIVTDLYEKFEKPLFLGQVKKILGQLPKEEKK